MILQYHCSYYIQTPLYPETFTVQRNQKTVLDLIDMSKNNGFGSILYTLFVVDIPWIWILLIIWINIDKLKNLLPKQITFIIKMIFIVLVIWMFVGQFITGSLWFYIIRWKHKWILSVINAIIISVIVLKNDRNNKDTLGIILFLCGIFGLWGYFNFINTSETDIYNNIEQIFVEYKKYINDENIEIINKIITTDQLDLSSLLNKLNNYNDKMLDDPFLCSLAINTARKITHELDLFKYSNTKIKSRATITEKPNRDRDIKAKTVLFFFYQMLLHNVTNNYKQTKTIEDILYCVHWESPDLVLGQVSLYYNLLNVKNTQSFKRSLDYYENNILNTANVKDQDIYEFVREYIEPFIEIKDLKKTLMSKTQIKDFFTVISQNTNEELEDIQNIITKLYTMFDSKIFKKYNIEYIFFKFCRYTQKYTWSEHYGNTTYYYSKEQSECFPSYLMDFLILITDYILYKKLNNSEVDFDDIQDFEKFINYMKNNKEEKYRYDLYNILKNNKETFDDFRVSLDIRNIYKENLTNNDED